MVQRELRIVNEKGLHARASAKFVELVEAHDAQVEVENDGLSVAGDSIMGLLTLGAPRGSTIRVTVSGPEAEELAQAIEALVASGFVEAM